MSEEITVTHGSGNVFRDIGFSEEESEELQHKALLTHFIYTSIMRLRLSAGGVAETLQIPLEDAVLLCRARHTSFSVEQLQRFNTLLQGKVFHDLTV